MVSKAILFTNPATCAPCRAFKPHWDIVQYQVPEIEYEVVDLGEDFSRADEYNITSVPTVVLVDGEEHHLGPVDGGAVKLISFIKSFL